ncbi:uncharacterized protein DUF3349 [Ornithinimicrobium humiphilum]|uniref:Uncharacterized protein DUF3349 n=1 Tax=Ornithinimicrobium humiphilum TaxID=125288 RepID=A0A543K7I8_9MICO|nr:uncharacterized protein DUF3349 [Ornithinimicrobium humiphilum]
MRSVEQTGQGRRPGVIGRVVTWLRAGYPEGIPTGDYVALLGVLRRRLHEDEIAEIVELLAQQRELGVTSERIRELIREYSLQDPYEADVERVTALLREAGYPVDGEEFPEDDEPDDEPDAETSEVDLQEPGPDGADRP